jgi:hypothetical protein
MNSLIAGMLAACAQPTLACDLCSVYAATEAQGGSGQGFLAGFAEQFTYFNTFQSGGRDAPNPDAEYINSLSSQLFVGYNINERVGVQFNLPVIYRDYGSTDAHASEAGIGDASLLANILLYQKIANDFTFSWRALAGIKFPTGDAHHLDPNEPDFAAGIGGHDLTLGSGSYDGVVGTGFFARWRRVFMTGAMQYAVRSEGEFAYQFDNDWIWFGGPGAYLVLGHKYTLSLQAVVSGESKGEDTVAGVATEDTAATIVYLGPQVNFTWGSKLSVQAGADLPVSVETTGDQVVPDYRVHAALTCRF